MGVLLYLGGGHTHSHSHGFSASRVNTDAAVYLPGGERENQLLLQGNEEGVAKGHSHQSANINIRAAFVHVLGLLLILSKCNCNKRFR
jgi:hypothetical protein